MKRIPALTALTALLALWTITVFGLIQSEALAAVPQLINFQGILRDGSGNPVANGSYFATFRIYGVPSGGTALWVDTQTVATSSGLFNATLGKGAPIPDSVFNDSVRYLGITVFPDGEMTPRQRFSSVGYAYESAQWTLTGQNLFRLNANVGIGTASPQAKLHVSGDAEGLRIQGNGVGGPGGAYASFYDAAGTGIGYVGDGSSGNQDMYLTSYVGAVHLYTPAGAALTADSSGNVGIGEAPSGDYKLLVVNDNPVASAVAGFSSNAFGVYGRSSLSSGVYGSSPYRGVFGTSSSGDGVFGTSSSGRGVFGSSSSGDGVFGQGFSGFAGYFDGNVHVTGTLTKGGGAFKIDHPTDPANKYLYHSFVESPDMMNIYNGNVTLNSKGEAVIALPDWFGALNKDFRYQLTCIGGFAQVYVAEKVKNNRFKIAGGTAGLEVSWQVTGIRQDAYANAHRIPVEELKSDKERGYYLHPDLFGQPEEKGTEWARHPEMMKEMKVKRLQAEKEQK